MIEVKREKAQGLLLNERDWAQASTSRARTVSGRTVSVQKDLKGRERSGGRGRRPAGRGSVELRARRDASSGRAQLLKERPREHESKVEE